jgi:hypothetical protein
LIVIAPPVNGVSRPSLSAPSSLSGFAPLAAVPLAVLAAASSPDGLATFAAIRLASSRVSLIAVRRGDYVGNRGECGSARLALETTLMTDTAEKVGVGAIRRRAT